MRNRTSMRAIPHAIFICKSCQKSTYALFKQWNVDVTESKPKIITKTIPIHYKHYKVRIYIKDSQWTLSENYKIALESFHNLYFDYFPLCSDCMKEYIYLFTDITQFYDSFSSYIIKHVYNKNNIVPSKFLDEVYLSHHRLNDFKKAVSSIKVIKPLLGKEPIRKIKYYTQPKSPTKNIQMKKNLKQKRKTKDNSSIISSIILVKSFQISFNKHYGTINEMRIGNLTPDEVPIEEIERGLYFLGHLIVTIGAFINIDVSEIRLSEFLEFKVDNSKKYDPIFTSDIKSMKLLDSFNEKITQLFAVSNKLFSSQQICDNNIKLPYIIDISSKTINGNFYSYDRREPWQFTLSMKLLLYDFKTIQFASYQMAIDTL
ncbi:hypothetical protein TRFO_41811 [Tritrichomonas foetus]|uniref:Atg6 BARA domain-containing protein n=1 Tax=Tritrichomonas foetus TaxID=1144522 RepID=A0A1J4KZA6_9EUKA|nr:hypothetical protein TRFO_41811 [Tritrichomonas foetus]|eukprot:OHT16490.1 hypothetical protein TRFO_41811 [Tritrichomonas foetus]